MRKSLITVSLYLFLINTVQAAAPYVNAQAIKERFDSISDKDMALLRSKRILFASRSFGLNLRKGLKHLEKADQRYAILDNYQRFDVFKAGGDLSIIPTDIFDSCNFVHFMASYWPHTTRLKEVETLLAEPPHEFHKHVDIVCIYYHTAMANIFETYAHKMDSMREAYPHITFIYVCAGYMAASQEKSNAEARKFNDLVRARYQGKVPLYDLGAILSDDGRVGDVYCPEYSKDPAGVHPNLTAGESMMAKGFLLVMRDALKQGGNSIKLKAQQSQNLDQQALATDDPEYQAVRAILDANNLQQKKVASVSMVEDGHIVALYLQEGGVTKLTDDIGKLRHLRTLHLYGDRELDLPLLQHLSPAIGKCTRLEDLLLNHNELSSLPKEISRLKKISSLSLADNKLKDLPSAAQRWAEKFDPDGLKQQH